jgi:MFS family permease
MCFGVSTGMVAFSYPASIIGTTLAQPSFLSYMNLLDGQGVWSSQATPLIGAMSGVFQAGGVFGIIGVTYVMEKWGRKAAVHLCSIIGLIGGALVCASQNVAMFIVFKFLAGMSSWAFVAISR